MAESLTRTACLALTLAAANAAAQGLPDPTRPPAAALTSAAQGGAVADAPLAPTLQSVMIGHGPSGRRYAVISGQTVGVGDKVGQSVVERIAAGEVVLRAGGRRQVLALYPDGGTRKKTTP